MFFFMEEMDDSTKLKNLWKCAIFNIQVMSVTETIVIESQERDGCAYEWDLKWCKRFKDSTDFGLI